MRILAIFAVLLLLFSQEAEARCRAGFVKRLSLGICVDRHSKLAARFIRPRGQSRIDETAPEPVKRQDRVVRSRKAAKAPPAEVIPSEDELLPIDIPTGIGGSILMRPPPGPFDWLSPEHQHP